MSSRGHEVYHVGYWTTLKYGEAILTVFGVVFARGGSKGLPGKNLMRIDGVPLVGLSVITGCAVPEIDRMYCSSDSEEILAAARNYGAATPFIRPKALASDASPELLSWKHFAKYLISAGNHKDDVIVSLPPTAPLRSVIDIQKVIESLATGPADMVVTYAQASHNPWFTIVTVGSQGDISIVNTAQTSAISRRQDAPLVYNITPVAYASTLKYVIETESLFGGTIRGVEVPSERAIDIDTELDFRIAEFLFTHKANGPSGR